VKALSRIYFQKNRCRNLLTTLVRGFIMTAHLDEMSVNTEVVVMSTKIVTVPREPTDEMIEALAGVVSEMFGIDDCYEGFVQAYKAMVAVGAKELPPRENADEVSTPNSIETGFNFCLDEIERRHFGLEAEL
jgi:hypothetical protein